MITHKSGAAVLWIKVCLGYCKLGTNSLEKGGERGEGKKRGIERGGRERGGKKTKKGERRERELTWILM